MANVGEEILLLENNKENLQMVAKDYRELGYYWLLFNNCLESEKYIKRSIELDPEETLTFTKLALLYLMQNKFDDAEEIYRNLKDLEFGPVYNRSSYRSIFIHDIENIENEGIKLDFFSKIRKLLN